MSDGTVLRNDAYLRALADIVAAELEKAAPDPLPTGGDNDPWLLDRQNGWTEYLHQDPADPDSFAIEFVADVGPTLEANKRLYNDGDGYSPSREWRYVAEIPPIMVEIWKRQYGVDPLARGNEALLKRLLNDPDLRGLRTSPGRL